MNLVLLGVKEAARYLKMSTQSIYKEVEKESFHFTDLVQEVKSSFIKKN